MLPGLLIPVLGVYLRFFTLKRGWVLPTMVISIGVSLLWLIIGTITSVGSYEYKFLGIEPFYPGLGVSILFWLIGRKPDGGLLEETEFLKEKTKKS
jgi:SSS family solute:Na+ symporter